MTTPEGPYYMADPDEDRGFHIIEGPADFSVSLPYFLEAARLAVFLNAQHAEIERLREENARLREATRWRSVEKELPPDDMRIVLFWDGKYHEILGLVGEELWSKDFACGNMEGITHWQPLPEPPQEEK